MSVGFLVGGFGDRGVLWCNERVISRAALTLPPPPFQPFQPFQPADFISFSLMKDFSHYIKLCVSISNEAHVCGKLNTGD